MTIYIHGFGGSGCGVKAELFRTYFKSINQPFIAPSLSYIPHLAIKTLEVSTAIGTTKCVLVQFKTNPDYPIMEICEAISDFYDKFNNADMLFCSLADKNLDKNYVSVTILFSGLDINNRQY